MANQFGIDMGQVYRTTEAVKGSRQQRKSNELQLDWKKEDRESARQRTQTLNQLRSRVGAGGEDGRQAERELISIAPEEAAQVQEAFSNMDERERKQMAERVETLGRMNAFILQGGTQEEQQRRYQTARQNVGPELAAKMPEEYDPNFVQMGLARARELDDLLQNPDKITFGGEDRLYKDGQLVESTTSNALLKQQAGGSDGGMKSSDESLMYRQVAAMYGGIVDPKTNQIRNLTRSQAGKVQAISSEAARLFQTGEATTRSGAVAMAARKLGIEVRDLGQGGTMDRNELLETYSQ